MNRRLVPYVLLGSLTIDAAAAAGVALAEGPVTVTGTPVLVACGIVAPSGKSLPCRGPTFVAEVNFHRAIKV